MIQVSGAAASLGQWKRQRRREGVRKEERDARFLPATYVMGALAPAAAHDLLKQRPVAHHPAGSDHDTPKQSGNGTQRARLHRARSAVRTVRAPRRRVRQALSVVAEDQRRGRAVVRSDRVEPAARVELGDLSVERSVPVVGERNAAPDPPEEPVGVRGVVAEEAVALGYDVGLRFSGAPTRPRTQGWDGRWRRGEGGCGWTGGLPCPGSG